VLQASSYLTKMATALDGFILPTGKTIWFSSGENFEPRRLKDLILSYAPVANSQSVDDKF